jgi:uncharacterized membrane protein YvbJ
MKKLISFVCPSCGANICADDDREFTFCQFCGKRIAISDENKQTYRHIDDAEVIRARTDNELSLIKLELEEKKINSYTKIMTRVIITLAVLFVVTIVVSDIKDARAESIVAMLLFLLVIPFALGVILGDTYEKRKK